MRTIFIAGSAPYVVVTTEENNQKNGPAPEPLDPSVLMDLKTHDRYDRITRRSTLTAMLVVGAQLEEHREKADEVFHFLYSLFINNTPHLAVFGGSGPGAIYYGARDTRISIYAHDESESSRFTRHTFTFVSRSFEPINKVAVKLWLKSQSK